MKTNIIRHNLFDDYNINNFNKALNKFFNSEDNEIATFMPTINTREDDNAYHIEVDLPGIKKEEVDINIDGTVLSISGERKFKSEKKEKDYYKLESSFGKFQRRINLPDNVDVENIEAKCNDGVLEVILPKIAKNQAKKITVK